MAERKARGGKRKKNGNGLNLSGQQYAFLSLHADWREQHSERADFAGRKTHGRGHSGTLSQSWADMVPALDYYYYY